MHEYRSRAGSSRTELLRDDAGVAGLGNGVEEGLIASCWTTAGAASPLDEDQRSPVPFATRVALAADAGFTGFGITHADILALSETMGLDVHGTRFPRPRVPGTRLRELHRRTLQRGTSLRRKEADH